MTDLKQTMRLGRSAGWALFAAMFLPVVLSEPQAIPVLVFWLLPVSLPFLFGFMAALAFGRVLTGRGLGAWAGGHTAITVAGALLLPIWLAIVYREPADLPRWLGFVGPVLYLALLPAALKLFSRRTSEWRFARALTLNAVGCLIFAAQFFVVVLDDLPGPTFWLGLPALGVLVYVGRNLEKLVLEYPTPAIDGELPKARVAR